MDSEDNILLNKQLLLNISENDIESFNRFFQLQKERVYDVALKMTRSHEIAQELSQDFFLKLWDRREDLTSVQNPAAYVYMSVYYMAINYLKRRGNEARILELRRMASPHYSNDTQERIDERQLRGYIDKAALLLPRLQQQVFQLRYIHQESYEAIGELLGITRGTAQSYFHLALKFIREYIDKQFLPPSKMGNTGNAGMLVLVMLLQQYH
ncbi:RNA polymerase sigma-70 factor, ECF subfamily [Filimonas lacunae]|uniref:RNA polymerase sigma-70 factor, ECF subfamily n=1 Tax=Filimonas lacunae TaxID=477680 RepID=A0A173MK07_9BACT|nr:sigma-70 family RNA polymerase sigma factor [Filimonas lacunae]BAV07741.1 RNA polymerase ECF-type sigma factor [Filimonas lacunae]SIT04289.1 RNA polymerase sigma-70 factor, ECF subfamily [Filimonas lacunae]